MANKGNKVKKKIGRRWRKKLANHMNDVIKHGLRNENNEIDKENILTNSNQISSNYTRNGSHLQDKVLHVLQNVELNPISSIDINNEHNSQEKDVHALPYVELFPMKPIQQKALDDIYKESDVGDDYYNVTSHNETENICTIGGRRIIDIGHFYKSLQEICSHNKAFGCTLSNVHIVSEKRKGLLTKFKLICNMCNSIFYLDSEHNSSLDLNKAAASGIISSGIGYTQCTELCASIDCPSFSQKHYAKIQNETYDDWQTTTVSVMEAAATREREAAFVEGRTKNGIACIDVIVDGAWSKRSYGTNFLALSGAAAIIGKKFGEVLFIGVKNKYCCICARAENKGVRAGEHVCFKNYNGPSTGMESEILLEGFKQSVPMYNLIYERMIADGDSSTYNKILDGRPYPDCTVEKVECKNHIFRNMCRKLKSITTETKYPCSLRKKITTQRILAIRKVICASISQHISKDVNFETKVSRLYTDITNSYNHAFGNHENCQPYYCNSQRNSADLTLILKTCNIWHRIKFIVNTVASKARSLMHNCDSNKVESFNSIIAKFVGGKRINFSLRRGYESRCNAAVVSFNTKRPLSTLRKAILGRSPKSLVKKFETSRLKQREIGAKYKRKGRKLFCTSKENDKDYGENCQKPDMPELEYNRCKEDFMKNLPSSEEERKEIEKSTILQRDSSQWLELRRKLLTASNFAKVVNRRQNTSAQNLVKTLIYPKNISHVLSLRHGIENEAVGLEQIISQLNVPKLNSQINVKIEPCGLFIDKKLPFLGATPDGVVGDDTIVEIKCPITAFKTSLNEAIDKKKVTFWKKTNKGLVVNKKHPWFIQVQGQLHITGRRQCIFAVWSGCNETMKVEMITKDDQFWDKMEPKLEHFYQKFMLPELCDPRHTRNMPIRDVT